MKLTTMAPPQFFHFHTNTYRERLKKKKTGVIGLKVTSEVIDLYRLYIVQAIEYRPTVNLVEGYRLNSSFGTFFLKRKPGASEVHIWFDPLYCTLPHERWLEMVRDGKAVLYLLQVAIRVR